MVKYDDKVFKKSKKKIVKITTTKNGFKNFNFRKTNIYMYAWAPKFIGGSVQVRSSYWGKYFVVEEHWYVQLNSSAGSPIWG